LTVAEQLTADLIELLNIPANYKVLFLQGGATAQFAMIPLNLLAGKQTANYVMTGAWSKKAIKEAKKYCQVNIAASSEQDNFTSIPALNTWEVDQQAAYLHYTPNETIHGVEFHEVPEVGQLPLVVDMSSNILSKQIDVNQYGLIYAGSQKNMGPAGLTVVIVREDLLGSADAKTPSVFEYSEQIASDSMLNTPATYNWYLVGLVLQWLKRQGGLSAIEQINSRKSTKLYQAIDESSLYSNPVNTNCRSRMNIPFILGDASLNSAFLQQAQENGFEALKGHRAVGGMRASIYNAMPEQGVDALIQFMAEFERTH
jgi:phosphoserine aminotransferase